MLQKSIFLITLLKRKFIGISGVFSKLEPSLKAHSIQLPIPPERAYFAISIRLSPTEIPKEP